MNPGRMMVEIAARESGGTWFGIAWSGTDFVATAVGGSEADALATVRRCLPAGTKADLHAGASPFLVAAASMLARLEVGDETGKRFTLSREHLSPPLYRIYSAAAAIPIGFVTTYGAIARAVKSEARPVGRAMATNPLYPIVPCHRVVGADFSLIGYGGRQDDGALEAKLARLEAEARGALEDQVLELEWGYLELYPVERVIYATREADARTHRRLGAQAARRNDEALQQRLF